ncbi:MAG: TPR repeat protein [Gammaproteobacteria bacterium]
MTFAFERGRAVANRAKSRGKKVGFSVRRAVLVVGLSVCLLGAFAAEAAHAQSPSFGLRTEDPVYTAQALRILAEQGDKRAAFLLASRYATASGGVPRDDSEAVRWYMLAAEGGLAEAQYNLGIMYATGRGVPLDPDKAAQWYGRAAGQGLAEAQFNLGTLYGTGRGVRRDEALAVKWLTKAAQRGLARAQYNLGALYEHGRGVRLNAHAALEWYKKAADQGLEQATFRYAALARKMRVEPDKPAVAKARKKPAISTQAPSVAAALNVPRTGTSSALRGPGPAGQDWVRDASDGQFTVQLASFAARTNAQRFADTLGDKAPVGIYQSIKKGKTWFAVVRGLYGSHAAAVASVATLSAKLRKMKPWSRSFSQIHQQMR